MVKLCKLLIIFTFSVALTGCVSTRENDRENYAIAISFIPDNGIIEDIMINASRCWFQSGDAAFVPYKLVVEMETPNTVPRMVILPYDNAGQPRISVVSTHNKMEKPPLVIEVRRRDSKTLILGLHGTLMTAELRKRISNDIERWKKGSKAC